MTSAVSVRAHTQQTLRRFSGLQRPMGANQQGGDVSGVATRCTRLNGCQHVAVCLQTWNVERGFDHHSVTVCQPLGIIATHTLVFVPEFLEVCDPICVSFLFKNFHVLVRFALVWAEHQEIGFAGTLGIGNNDIRRDDGFHDDFLSLP